METNKLDEEDYICLLALTKTPGIGPVTARNLIAYCKGVSNVFKATKAQLLNIPDVGEATLKSLNTPEPRQKAEIEYIQCVKNDVSPIGYLDSEYPEALKVIHNGPLVIFKRGNLVLNDYIGVSVVGTRKPTEYGKMWAIRFAEAFALNGLNVVSGLAYGIDGQAHKAVVQVGGITTAVLAHGLDRVYPSSHSDLAKRIVDGGGALITEYPWGTQIESNYFPARNRIIAALSRAVVIIEAAEKGGALITANFAFEQDREVYAVPGALGARFSEGCNLLIRKQIAQLVTDPQQVLDAMNQQIAKVQPHLFTPVPSALTKEEQIILNALEQNQLNIDHLTEKTELPSGKLLSLLLELEFKGLVVQSPGKKFRRN